MKKIFSKVLISALLAVLISAPVFADSAKVTFVKGKVEVNRGGEWIALNVGDLVAESETISTGFQAEARLNLNGSVLAVAALSRVTLESFSTNSNKDNVSLYVNAGAVRSRVTHTESKKVDFTTRTPVAVASVRGTDFSMTSAGKVSCFEGAVAVYSAKDYNPDRKTSDKRDEAPADEEPAESTTPVDDISSSAPLTAVVVGAGQTTTITSAGVPEKPMSQAKKNAEKSKSTVKTAAEKEAVVSAEKEVVVPKEEPKPVDPTPVDPTPVDPTPVDPTPVEPPTTGGIEVEIEVIPSQPTTGGIDVTITIPELN